MKLILNYSLRALCLVAYAMAVAKLAGLLPAGIFDRAPIVAGVLLALHAAELVLMFKQVRLYRGALAVSVLLTLLFGLLHWKPLADQQALASRRG
jgi:uncharacterized membrane protein (UPF0136 family)